MNTALEAPAEVELLPTASCHQAPMDPVMGPVSLWTSPAAILALSAEAMALAAQ